MSAVTIAEASGTRLDDVQIISARHETQKLRF